MNAHEWSLKAETTEHAARDNTQRGTNDTRERNKRREDSSLLFFSPRVLSPLACFLPSRVFSPRVFYHNAGVPPTANFFEFKLQPHYMFCRLSFQWASRTFTWQRKPHVFRVSYYRALHIEYAIAGVKVGFLVVSCAGPSSEKNMHETCFFVTKGLLVRSKR